MARRLLLDLALAAALATGLGSCLTLNWSRVEFGAPPAEGELESLVPAECVLEDCLAVLGPPLQVWEVTRETYALAYGWEDSPGWGFNLSVPVSKQFSASLDFDDLSQRLHGAVLVFDREHRLLSLRRGFLAELLPDGDRRRPAPFPDPEAEERDARKLPGFRVGPLLEPQAADAIAASNSITVLPRRERGCGLLFPNF